LKVVRQGERLGGRGRAEQDQRDDRRQQQPQKEVLLDRPPGSALQGTFNDRRVRPGQQFPAPRAARGELQCLAFRPDDGQPISQPADQRPGLDGPVDRGALTGQPLDEPFAPVGEAGKVQLGPLLGAPAGHERRASGKGQQGQRLAAGNDLGQRNHPPSAVLQGDQGAARPVVGTFQYVQRPLKDRRENPALSLGPGCIETGDPGPAAGDALVDLQVGSGGLSGGDRGGRLACGGRRGRRRNGQGDQPLPVVRA